MNSSIGLSIIYLMIYGTSFIGADNSQTKSTGRSQDSLFNKLIDPRTSLSSDAASKLEPLSEQSKYLSNRYERSKAREAGIDGKLLDMLEKKSIDNLDAQLLSILESKINQASEAKESDQNLQLKAPVDRPSTEHRLRGIESTFADRIIQFKFNVSDSTQQRLLCWLEPSKPAAASARQLNSLVDRVQGPNDFLSKLQRRLIEGKNKVEDHIDQHLGISLPTKLIEKKKDSSVNVLENFDEGRALHKDKDVKVVEAKLAGVTNKLNVVEMALNVIQRLIKLISSGSNGENRSLLVDVLQEMLKALANLS